MAHLTFFLFAFAAVFFVIAVVPLLVGGVVVALLAVFDAKAMAQRRASGHPVEARTTWLAFIGVSAVGLLVTAVLVSVAEVFAAAAHLASSSEDHPVTTLLLLLARIDHRPRRKATECFCAREGSPRGL